MIFLIAQFTKSIDFAVLYSMIEIMGFTTEAITMRLPITPIIRPLASTTVNCEKSELNKMIIND